MFDDRMQSLAGPGSGPGAALGDRVVDQVDQVPLQIVVGVVVDGGRRHLVRFGRTCSIRCGERGTMATTEVESQTTERLEPRRSDRFGVLSQRVEAPTDLRDTGFGRGVPPILLEHVCESSGGEEAPLPNPILEQIDQLVSRRVLHGPPPCEPEASLHLVIQPRGDQALFKGLDRTDGDRDG